MLIIILYHLILEIHIINEKRLLLIEGISLTYYFNYIFLLAAKVKFFGLMQRDKFFAYKLNNNM